MSADVATYPRAIPATPPPTPADFKYEEPKIYISTAKLKLKLSAVENNKDYIWHTHVVQPIATEIEEVADRVEMKQSLAPAAAVVAVNENLNTPDHKYDTLAATLFNFIDVERYHSEKNQLAAGKGSKKSEKQNTDF